MALGAAHTALVALATDAVLPALPAVAGELGAQRANDAQFVITAFFAGFALAQLVVGPLSDRIGRRRTLQGGLLLFLVGCFVSWFAPTFEIMIFGRVLQGVGGAAGRVMGLTIVRDLFVGREMARLLSLVLAVFIVCPIVAPALGQAIETSGGWRAIFVTFAGLTAAVLTWFTLRQSETLAPSARRPFSFRTILGGFREVLGYPAAVSATVAGGFVFSSFLSYLSTAPQIFREGYDTGALFPFWFGVNSFTLGCAAIANTKLVMRFGRRRLIRFAGMFQAVASILALGPTFLYEGLPPFWFFMVWMTCMFLSAGLLMGNLNAVAMEPLGRLAGLGAAFVGTGNMFIALPLGGLAGQLFNGRMYSVMGIYGFCGLASWTAMRWGAARA